eukprot:9912341-Lingulodinium_polyedra.AAC.1
MRACYSFIRRSYRARREVWDSVKQELLIAAALLPVVRHDLCMPYCSTVVATDASSGGWGICESKAAPEE